MQLQCLRSHSTAWSLPVLALLLCTGLTLTQWSQPAHAWFGSKKNKTQSVKVTRQSRTLTLASAAMDTQKDALVLGADRPIDPANDYRQTTLTNPHRLIIDFPNAQLTATPSQSVLPINRKGIKEIQFQARTSYRVNTVQLTVVGESAEALQNLKINVKDHLLRVELEGSSSAVAKGEPGASTNTSQPTVATKPIRGIDINPSPAYQDNRPVPSSAQFQVEDIYVQDGQLIVQGKDNGEILIKNQFTLASPSRLVLDLDNAGLAHRKLMAPITFPNGKMKSIRVGQFDERTVRIVMETDDPEQYLTGYVGQGRSTLKVYTAAPMYAGGPSDPSQRNQVESVSVLEGGAPGALPSIRLAATGPISHHISRDQKNVYIEMPNSSANPGWVGYNADKFPALEGVKLEKRPEGRDGSVLVITAKDPIPGVTTRMSADGRTLDIYLSGSQTAAKAPEPTIILGPSGRKGPAGARVVVDAGHGGKDAGAQRGGYNEKDLNLRVALKLRRALEDRGLTVYMTRSTDVFLPLSGITSIANQIRPDVFVSVHQNASVNSSIHGFETYYYTPQSIALARRVNNRMASKVDAPDRGVRRAMFYVIHHTSVPAILCEVGYMSNPGELAELVGDARQSATAQAIADGVVDFLYARNTAQTLPAPDGNPFPDAQAFIDDMEMMGVMAEAEEAHAH